MTDLIKLGENAVKAKYKAALIPSAKKNEVLVKCAKALKENADEIIAANELDLKAAVQNGMSEAMQDRLRLTKERIDGIAEGLVQVADLPDPAQGNRS